MIQVIIIAHVMTAELSWYVQNCDLMWSLFFMPEWLTELNLDHELKAVCVVSAGLCYKEAES